MTVFKSYNCPCIEYKGILFENEIYILDNNEWFITEWDTTHLDNVIKIKAYNGQYAFLIL